MIPGTKFVRATEARGTGYFCGKHMIFIFPMWVMVEGIPYATCDECFLDDLCTGEFGDFGDAEDIPGVEMDDIVSEMVGEQLDAGTVLQGDIA